MLDADKLDSALREHALHLVRDFSKPDDHSHYRARDCLEYLARLRMVPTLPQSGPADVSDLWKGVSVSTFQYLCRNLVGTFAFFFFGNSS